MSEIAALDKRLQELHGQTAEAPLFNPVFQLSHELSRRMEKGDLSLDAVEALVAELECEGLSARARRLNRLVAPVAAEANLARVKAMAEGGDFASFAARWSRPVAHVVFTAHPTFLLPRAQAAAVAASASAGDGTDSAVCAAPAARDVITLDSEHADAMAAIARAQSARDGVNGALIEVARARWPQQWRSLRPMPARFASWVGYDMDGRTDIGWHTCIRYRLEEKAQRLASYAALLADAAPDIATRLLSSSERAGELAALFAGPMSDPDELSAAAN
ncbi:MAG TPA: phosphoenolpyruvate carboxylase, partial [Novosphingobium sp.]|nr:phosphoenolpyruvate carboxylase [Novosphingobium sp.]